MTRARLTVAAALTTAVIGAACGSTVPLASRPAAARTGAAGRDTSLEPAPASGSDTAGANAATSGSGGGTGSGLPSSGATARAPTNPLSGGSSGAAAGANHSPISLGVLYAVNDGAQSA